MKKKKRTKKNPPLPKPPSAQPVAAGALGQAGPYGVIVRPKGPALPDPLLSVTLRRSQLQDLFALVESRVRICNIEALFGREEDRPAWKVQADKWSETRTDLQNSLQEDS